MQLTELQDDFPRRVRQRVRNVLGERRITTRALADQIGWSQSYVAHRLTGRRPFSIDDLNAIAVALDVAPEDLLTDSLVTSKTVSA